VLTLQGVIPLEKNFKQTLYADINGFSLHAAVPTSARRSSNCAATSPALLWPTNGCSATRPDRLCSS
jgi:hypothetical protein